MGANRLQQLELFALELGKIAAFDFVYSQASTNMNQSVPNFATICMAIRSRMISIMGHIEPEHPELFALEFGKFSESDSVYSLSSTNFNQSAPNLVRMHATIRSRMSSIVDLIGPEEPELSALELENFPYLTLFTLYHLQISINQYQSWPQYICP